MLKKTYFIHSLVSWNICESHHYKWFSKLCNSYVFQIIIIEWMLKKIVLKRVLLKLFKYKLN